MAIKRIVCTVTNDLHYDQRMRRICTSLSNAGYQVTLIGRRLPHSPRLNKQPYSQKRLFCFFTKGKLFYAEYNLRLFLYLLFLPADLFCAIDLDTILPNYLASLIRRKKRVYDAHELFCEMEEIVSRPSIYRIWKGIERWAVPRFPQGYTIGTCYAQEFEKMYGVHYAVVRNATVLQPEPPAYQAGEKYILYQGAVNEGRCFETLIPAMRHVDCRLLICGEGNFFEQAQQLVKQYQLQDKIQFTGYIEPNTLRSYTQGAYIGITLFTRQSKSNYLSMANRFFDYMHAGVPQICMDFPEYHAVNQQYEVALLLPDNTTEESIAKALRELLQNDELHKRLQTHCWQARKEYCWQTQENTLLQFYAKQFE